MTDQASQIRALAGANDGDFPQLVESSIAAGASPDQFLADLVTLQGRQPVSIATGQKLVAGEVLFETLTASATPGGSNVGNGALTIQSVGVDAIPGMYTAVCTAARTNRGLFELRDASGYVLCRINVGTPFVSSVMSLTIADSTTDFAVGDSFAIVVAGSASLKAFDFTADASPPQVAAAVLGEDVDATGGATEQFAVASGPSIVAAGFSYITQATDLTDEQKNAFNGVASLALGQLARRGIVLRAEANVGIRIIRRAPPTDS